MHLKDYINIQLQNGRYTFSLAVAEKELGKSNVAVRSAIAHLIAKGELANPARGFYVIVPPEYQILKCLPAEHFIPYLMDYWGINYYAALLTAARYHGSSHQSSHVFQVIIPKHKPEIICGKVKIKFYANKNIIETPTQKISTAKSRLIISTPEGTAMDLMHYISQSGGLNHIATVLSELQESISPEKLLLLAENQKSLPWKQRLGYILETIGSIELAEILKNHLKKYKKIDFIPLMPGIETKDVKKNKIWKILENTTIEGDDI